MGKTEARMTEVGISEEERSGEDRSKDERKIEYAHDVCTKYVKGTVPRDMRPFEEKERERYRDSEIALRRRQKLIESKI